MVVYSEMFFVIQIHYSMLPPPEELTATQIANYYRQIAPSLCLTKPGE